MALSSLIEKIQPLLGWLAAVSLVTFVISLLLIPFIISKLPTETFINIQKRARVKIRKSFKNYLFLLFTNILAVFLICSGIIMLFIPGQGLLTILVGFLLLSFPGKQKVVLNLIRRQQIQKSLNWIRVKQKRKPFVWPD